MNSMARSIRSRNSSLESTNWTPAPGGELRPFASWAETRCTTTPFASTGLPPSGSSMMTVTTACSSGGLSVCTKTPPALMLAAYSSTKSCTFPNRTPKRASTRGKARRGSSRGFCARDIAPIGVGGPEAEARARRCSNPAIRSRSVCGGSTNSAQYPPSGAERHSPTTAVASSACGPPGRYSLSETCVPGLGGRSEQTNTPSALTSRVVVCTIVGPAATRMGNTIGARILSFYRDAARATRRVPPHRLLPSPHSLPMPAAARGAGGPGPCAAGVGPIPSPPFGRPSVAKRTPLYEAHLAASARMIDFGGFEMPVQYRGLVEEHLAVRARAGIFAVSHMGEILFEGPRALEAAQRLVTNDLANCKDGQAQYAAVCNERGGVIDDVIVYRFSARRLLVCVNATGREKDFEWMRAHAGEGG